MGEGKDSYIATRQKETNAAFQDLTLAAPARSPVRCKALLGILVSRHFKGTL